MTQVEIEQAVESIWALFRETDRRFEETRREIADLSATIRTTESLFTSQWGRLMEALVKPGGANLFRDRGFRVTRTLGWVRARRGGEEMEIDPLLVDGEVLSGRGGQEHPAGRQRP